MIHSGADADVVAKKLSELKRKTFSLNPLMLENGGPLWKIDAAGKIKKAQMVLFFVGENSHKSPYVAWELKQAQKSDKPIHTVLLEEDNLRHTGCESHSALFGLKVKRQMPSGSGICENWLLTIEWDPRIMSSRYHRWFGRS